MVKSSLGISWFRNLVRNQYLVKLVQSTSVEATNADNRVIKINEKNLKQISTEIEFWRWHGGMSSNDFDPFGWIFFSLPVCSRNVFNLWYLTLYYVVTLKTKNYELCKTIKWKSTLTLCKINNSSWLCNHVRNVILHYVTMVSKCLNEII